MHIVYFSDAIKLCCFMRSEWCKSRWRGELSCSRPTPTQRVREKVGKTWQSSSLGEHLQVNICKSIYTVNKQIFKECSHNN